MEVEYKVGGLLVNTHMNRCALITKVQNGFIKYRWQNGHSNCIHKWDLGKYIIEHNLKYLPPGK